MEMGATMHARMDRVSTQWKGTDFFFPAEITELSIGSKGCQMLETHVNNFITGLIFSCTAQTEALVEHPTKAFVEI